LLPKHPKTGKRTMTLESDGFWVFKGAKEPELAFELVKFFASPTAQKMFMDAGYVIPSDIPEIANPWYAQKPDGLVKVLENLNTDSAKNGYTNFESATINSVVAPIILKAFADGSDIAQALKDADAAMNGELATAWELFAQ
jgi:ABC-type glycerol-3-phosphate transport system substrate-binding protein